MPALPILYSFRRCPYAMRARLALASAKVTVELREIRLRDKPAAMLEISPKGTVPVLLCGDGQVLEQSLDIMRWALTQAPELSARWQPASEAGLALIAQNDGPFKHWLDRYKYWERHPEHPRDTYRQHAEQILQDWEQRLQQNRGGLIGAQWSLADYALAPFVRQYARSDTEAFAAAPFPALQRWLEEFEQSTVFARTMPKWPVWSGTGPGLRCDWSLSSGD